MFTDDLRHAFRRIRSSLGFTLGIAALLGLGIGMTTAMFTVVDALLLRPVPFDKPEQLAQVAMHSRNGGRNAVKAEVLREWQKTPVFLRAEAIQTMTSIVEAGGTIVERPSAFVSPGLFSMLGVRALRGRLFDSGDGRSGTDDLVVIAEGLWRDVFNAAPDIIGRRISVDGESLMVMGVAPGDVRFPAWNTAIWRPLDFLAPPVKRAGLQPIAYVRIAPTVPREDVQRIGADVAHAADPATAPLFMRIQDVSGVRLDAFSQRAVPMLAGAVAFVTIVLCANISSLLLARLASRRREFGLCAALGASRRRLLRQALLEQSITGAAGAAAGVLLAWTLVSLTRVFLPDAYLLRTLNPIDLDLRALAVAGAVAVLSMAVAGIGPLLITSRFSPMQSMRDADRSGTASAGTRRGLAALVVVEVALACTLLVGSILLVRSFINLSRADRAISTSGVMTAWVSITGPQAEPATRTAISEAVLNDLRGMPGVLQVMPSFGVPPGGGATSYGAWRSDLPDASDVKISGVESYQVPGSFFDFYGIPLLRGRSFQAGDTDNTIIVSERMAALVWPGVDPVGHTAVFGKEVMHVIGVAREINLPSLDPANDPPEFYRPFTHTSVSMMSIRCQPCPDPARLRQRLVASHAAVRVNNVGMIEDQYREELARPRAAAALAFAFAAIAMAAAAAGLFGVLTYAVGRRRREFGIRSALGASPGSIRALVLRDGATVAAIGIALGVGGAWLLGRTLTAFEYGVSASDPLSWALVLSVLAATTVAAAWRPASTATRVSPVTLLRDE